MPLASRLRALRTSRWLGSGAWAVADQALFAGANFVANVLLARWLSPEGFGAYTVAFTVFLLLGTLHGGALSQPMLVYGASRYRDRLPSYLRLLLSGHLRFAAGAAVVLCAAGAAFWGAGQPILGHALLAFGVGQAAILFQWLMRSACYIETRPAVSASAGVLYAVLMLAGVAWLNAASALDESTAVVLMASASLASAFVMAARLGIPARRTDAPAFRADVVRQHRSYGGWAATTGVLEWYHGFLPFLLLPLFGGLDDTGALRALFNLVLPVLHIFHALANLLVPVFVRAREAGRDRQVGRQVAIGLIGATLVYAVVVELFGAALMHWLYDGKYDAYTGVEMWAVALLPIILAGSNVAQAMLRAQERPEAVFAARAAAAGVASTVGAGLVWLFGVAGALFADVAAALAETVVMARLLLRPPPPAPTDGGPHPDAGSRRHLLVVAFACSPGRGSEPGQGWGMVSRLAQHVDVTALVYQGFRRVIEAEMAERPIPGLRVVYVRVPGEHRRHFERGEDRSGWREQVHYHVWQRLAGRVARGLHDEHRFDAVLHSSFMRYWSPSAATGVPDAPFVWGPVGGGEDVPPGFASVLGWRGTLFAVARRTVRRLSHVVPSVRRTARHATLALATTEESAAPMCRLGARRVEVAAASVALPDEQMDALAGIGAPPDGPFRIVGLGRLLAWKGYALAIDALAATAHHPAMAGATLTLVGDGPDRRRLLRRAARRGVADRVTITGLLPRDEALAHLAGAHVLVHPSFHDSGGYATLEAMAAGRPVICLALGGPALQVTEATGYRVAATMPHEVVRRIGEAYVALATDPALAAALGAAARVRVRAHFSWHAVLAAIMPHLALIPPGGDGVPSPAHTAMQGVPLSVTDPLYAS